MRTDLHSSHRVRSNLGSTNNSFIKTSGVSTTGAETKWNQLNRITQGNGRVPKHDVRNHPLRQQNGINGRTQDFGGSLSSQEKNYKKE